MGNPELKENHAHVIFGPTECNQGASFCFVLRRSRFPLLFCGDV